MLKFLYLLIICLPLSLTAQKKDLPQLSCFLTDPVQHAPEKAAINVGQPEPKIILSSTTDTLVKACIDATISNVQKDEEGKWEIVFYHKDYWFWLSGVSKPSVRKDQKVKTGDAIGILQPGQKLELLLYDFETPIDPKKYMHCGK
ncbi:M23 family metallopeptidase [Terrimonas alba]|uniref:M23 family metallopeptidase n=1 Tax=Terrimonas alba TaxID=3349636 RepID=UPI0035F3C565